MILSVSPMQTTLYDQIRYQGSPSSFAWVLPINGVATVGLSADAVFGMLDQTSQTTIIAPESNCPPPPACRGFGAAGSADAGIAPPPGDPGVVVTHQQVVGPYETVQLHSTDPNALNTWLTSHGFAVPADVAPIISAYVNEHFDFLAMKLVPGAGVQAMRPVRVTTAGASPVLPLRMVAAGTGATVGITLWVVADGRYETQNFPWFHVDDSQLVWDWTSNQSNYKTIRAQKEAAASGAIWEVESSLSEDIQNMRSQIGYATQTYPSDPNPSYPPVPASDAGPGQSSDQERQDDLDTLFAGIAGNLFRLTRLRADLSHAALATDLVLQASMNQSVLSNVRRPTATNGAPQCPSYPDCPPLDDGGNPYPSEPNIPLSPPGSTSTNGRAESFSCATSTSASGDALLTYVALAGFLGFSIVRGRRRRS
jgi:hypothetical protein